MRRIRTYSEVADPGTEEIVGQIAAQRRRLDERLAKVGRLAAVASGKGGVGKSAVTANLAAALAAQGRRIGAVDADVNGPSLARMLGVRGGPLRVGGNGVEPSVGAAGVSVMSMDLLLAAPDAPLRWREPDGAGFVYQSTLETGALREFLSDVAWGEIDILFIDLPPGTDRLLRLFELLPRLDLLLLVTIPSEAARHVVAKSARAAREAIEGNSGAREVALVANMTEFRCPGCGRSETLYVGDAARALADHAGIPLWAEIPFEPALASATDTGRPWVLEGGDAPAARALRDLAARIAATGGTPA